MYIIIAINYAIHSFFFFFGGPRVYLCTYYKYTLYVYISCARAHIQFMERIGIMTPSRRMYIRIYVMYLCIEHNLYNYYLYLNFFFFIGLYLDPRATRYKLYADTKSLRSFFGLTAAIPFNRKPCYYYLFTIHVHAVYAGYNNVIADEWPRHATARLVRIYYVLWCIVFIIIFK